MNIYLFSAAKTTTTTAKTEGTIWFVRELDTEDGFYAITESSEADHVKEFMGRVGRNETKQFAVVAPSRAAAVRILQAIFPRNQSYQVKNNNSRPWSYS